MGARSAYKCIKECPFTICASCAECKSRHLMSNAKGKPPTYQKGWTVKCARCGRNELEKYADWWYCEDCDYGVCTECIKKND